MIAETQVRELVEFALETLPRMQLPDGTYCLEVHADDMRPRGGSIRYSAMVALGLLRARATGYEVDIDLDRLVDEILRRSTDFSLTPGDLGLLLWLDARAEADRANELLGALHQCLRRCGPIGSRNGMEVAWLGIGAAECISSAANGVASSILREACEQLCERRRSPSGLLLHQTAGPRRRFPNFATEMYGILALSKIASYGDEHALSVAREVADALLALQREDGGWPWLFDAARGRIVEPYEIYSVHQDALAPMGLLELYELTGEEHYRAAAVRGLGWIYGSNDLRAPMMDPRRRLIYRSIRRKSPLDRLTLFLNTATAYFGRDPASSRRATLEINRTDRPYHLGWLLEAWCGRENLIFGPG